MSFARAPSVLVPAAIAAAPALTGCKASGGARPAPPQAGDEQRARFLALLDPKGGEAMDARLRDLQGRVQRSPKKMEAWIELGQAWVRKARADGNPMHYLSASACADLALALAPGNRLALDLRGLVLLNDHRFDEARRLAQSVGDAEPDDAAAWGNLSDALLELGRVDEAARATQRMVDLKPNLPSYSRAAWLLWP